MAGGSDQLDVAAQSGGVQHPGGLLGDVHHHQVAPQGLHPPLGPEDRRVAVKSLYRVIDVPMFCAYCRKKDIKPV